jgi:hypothetical protein
LCVLRFLFHSLNLIKFLGCPSRLVPSLIGFAHWATTAFAAIDSSHKLLVVLAPGLEPGS